MLQHILISLFFCLPSSILSQSCDEFSVGKCSTDDGRLIFQYDVLPDADLCQRTCEMFAECHVFYFYSNGTCQLFSGDTRSECGLIGGSPDQSLVQCLIDTDHGCDAFTDLECQYLGQDIGLSPPNGQFKSAEECELLCKQFQILGCQYWVFYYGLSSCKILDSKERYCQEVAGPNYPLLDELDELLPYFPTSPTSSSLLGLMITGGRQMNSYLNDVEIFDIITKRKCLLNSLLGTRAHHTQNGLMACGGQCNNGCDDKPYYNCIKNVDGSWIHSHNITNRQLHTSWDSPNGIYLLGGDGSYLTTELLTDDGRSVETFPLKYGRMSPCLIDEGNTFLLTGGQTSDSSSGYIYTGTVSRYGFNGWIEDLQDLNIGRNYHGCVSYLNNDNERVNMVCGGFKEDPNVGGIGTRSCEINFEGSDNWTETKFVPDEVYEESRMINIDNHVLIIGGNTIYELNKESMEWDFVSNMLVERDFAHAVSAVPINNLWQYCI